MRYLYMFSHKWENATMEIEEDSLDKAWARLKQIHPDQEVWKMVERIDLGEE